MTPQERKVMELALEALELAQDNLRDHGDNCFLHDEGEYNRCFCGKDSLSDHLQSVVEKLDEALAQLEQEPVAVVTGVYGGRFTYAPIKASVILPVGTALYTRPQPRKPLSDEKMIECERLAGIRYRKHVGSIRGQQLSSADEFLWHYARAIEAAHNIKE